MAARVKSVEDQGSCKIMTLRLGDQTLKARLAEEDSVPDGQAWLTFPKQWTKLYADERLVN